MCALVTGVQTCALPISVVLGAAFLFFQASEYIHAYHELNLTLGSGIYGSTFFMLTGFHGLHVTLGAIMLSVIWTRCAKGHFDKEHHFGRSEEHTSELQSLMRISSAVFCLIKKKNIST